MTDSEYINRINIGIDTFLDEQIKAAPTKEAKKLIRRIKQTSIFGKRFRPALLRLAYRSYGGEENIVSIGVALELLHQTLLIHDDIIDEDLIRHNKPNIYGLYLKDSSNKTYALNQALLAGDLVHNFASNLIALEPQITKLFNDAFIQAIYGQQLDTLNVDNKLDGLTLNKLVNTAKLKTASYSTILPLLIGAKLTNQNVDEVYRLKEFGKSLGVYVQLYNDHKDYFSGNQLNDYTIGKITYPYIAGKKLAKANDLKYLIINFGTKTANKPKVVEILIKAKALESSLNTLNQYRDKTLTELDKLNIASQDKQKLVALIDRIGV